ncbi:hypothetical protein V1478_009504 [Vespula squamosa]|uniref:Uncharacterized protein n=1 Tax=Vespula squamosa TaxID=30214 RepID=A0ABD2APU1_VESSQ
MDEEISYIIVFPVYTVVSVFLKKVFHRARSSALRSFEEGEGQRRREEGEEEEEEEEEEENEEEENEEEDEEEEDVILRWYTSSPVPGSDVPLTRHT